jgi:hypothetical protein
LGRQKEAWYLNFTIQLDLHSSNSIPFSPTITCTQLVRNKHFKSELRGCGVNSEGFQAPVCVPWEARQIPKLPEMTFVSENHPAMYHIIYQVLTIRFIWEHAICAMTNVEGGHWMVKRMCA